MDRIAALVQSRITTMNEISGLLDFLAELPEYGTELFTNKKNKLNAESSRAILEQELEVLKALPEWNYDSVYNALYALAETAAVAESTKINKQVGKFMWPIRIAVSGKMVTPGGAVEICEILGREESLRRIQIGLEKLR